MVDAGGNCVADFVGRVWMHSTDSAVVFAIHMDVRASGCAELADGSLKRWSVGGRVLVGGKPGEAWRWWVANGRAFGVEALSGRCSG